MNAKPEIADGHPCKRPILAFLVCFHIVICCVSLIYVANYRIPYAFSPMTFHIFYDPARLHIAVTVVAAFAVVASLFVLAGPSFGYVVGLYFYTMILSYLWLNCFTNLNYDHRSAGFSAAASAVAFLLPALWITSPIGQVYTLSERGLDRLLRGILALGAATVAIGAIHNFRLVPIDDIYDYRDNMVFPTIVNYLISIVSSALLPFAFAGFVARNARWQAGAVLLVALLFYPVTLSKINLFAPFWLVAMLVLSRLFEIRIAVVLSLLGAILTGVILFATIKTQAAVVYFTTVNFRLIAVPAVAMDVYNDFFSRHDLTYFCQISPLKLIMSCPYQEQLSLVMEKAYKLGNFNGSLFVTEGIASVGSLFAPVSAFACGLVIALGNRLSAGLPAGFVLVSGAVLPQTLLNVPLSVVLLTHGAGLLFLLWYITPRTIFKTQWSNR